MAKHSSILARKIPWTEDPRGLVHGVAKNWTQLSNSTTTTDTRPGPEAPESNTQRGSCPSGSHNLAGKIEKS